MAIVLMRGRGERPQNRPDGKDWNSAADAEVRADLRRKKPLAHPPRSLCFGRTKGFVKAKGFWNLYLVGEGAGIRTLNLGLKSPAMTVRGRLLVSVLYLAGRRESPREYVAVCTRPCVIRGLVRGLDLPNQSDSLGVETKVNSPGHAV